MECTPSSYPYNQEDNILNKLNWKLKLASEDEKTNNVWKRKVSVFITNSKTHPFCLPEINGANNHNIVTQQTFNTSKQKRETSAKPQQNNYHLRAFKTT